MYYMTLIRIIQEKRYGQENPSKNNCRDGKIRRGAGGQGDVRRF
ncbi:MAG: hypothetical protein WBJ17_03575 [Natronincolaceae bacterium]